MKTHDGLGRSHRFSKTPSKTKNKRDHAFTVQDGLVLYFLQIHYQVPANFLRMFVGAKSHPDFVKRLKKAHRSHWGYIEVCPAQANISTERNYQPLTYQLTKKGKEKLKELGTLEEYTSRLSNWKSHQFYTHLFVQSVHLWCLKHELTFVPHQTKFKDKRATTKELKLNTSYGNVEPDQFFGIEYGDHVRFFAVEMDRATEGHETVLDKFKKYDEVYAKQLYKQWGTPNLTVLFFTSTQQRAENLLKHTYQKHFAFKWNRVILQPWHIPKEPWYEIMDTPWLTCEGEHRIDT